MLPYVIVVFFDTNVAAIYGPFNIVEADYYLAHLEQVTSNSRYRYEIRPLQKVPV